MGVGLSYVVLPSSPSLSWICSSCGSSCRNAVGPPWTAFPLDWQGRQQVVGPVRQEEDRMGSGLLGESPRPLVLSV